MLIEFNNPVEGGISIEEVKRLTMCNDILRKSMSITDIKAVEDHYRRPLPKLSGLSFTTKEGLRFFCPLDQPETRYCLQNMRRENYISLDECCAECYVQLSAHECFNIIRKMRPDWLAGMTAGEYVGRILE